MGQTSSQLDSTQTHEFIPNLSASTNVRRPSPHVSKLYPNLYQLSVPPSSLTRNMAAPAPNMKRARSPSDTDEVLPRIVKKLKTHDDHVSRKKRKAGRSMPQHCRGTAIRPSQDFTTQLPSQTNVRVPDTQEITSPRPQTSSSAGEEFYDASSVAILDGTTESHETRAVTGALKQEEAKPVEKLRKQKAREVEDADDAEDQVMIMEDVVVNPIGRPGPRRRKKAKRVKNGQASENREDIMDAQTKDSRVSAHQEPHSPKLDYHKASRLDRDLIHHFKAAFENEQDPAKRDALRTKFILDNDVELEEEEKPSQRASQQQAETVRESQRTALPSVRLPAQHGPTAPPAVGARDVEGTAGRHNSTSVPAQPKKIVTKQPPKITQAPTPISPPPAQADRIPTPTSLESQGHAANNDDVEPAADFGEDDVGDNAEEHTAAYDHRGTGYVDPTDQISQWLDHPQSPAPPDQIPPSMGSPKLTKKPTETEQTKEPKPKQTKKAEKSSKRKRESKSKSMARVDDSGDEYQDGREANQEDSQDSEAEVEKKPKQNKQRGQVKGAWSDEEKALADSIFNKCCKEYDLTPFDLNAQMGDWPGVEQGFRDDIYAAFPLREIKAIRNFCQRRYHIRNTGPWTEEGDQQLRKFYARCRDEHGKEGWWVEIASDMGRSAQACRDRWKNIVGIEDTANLGPWTREEEDDLIGAVDQHLFQELRAALPEEERGIDQAQLEMMADWNRIAQLMQGKRSTKRCREKWKQLKRRYATTEDTSLQQTTAQAEERPPGQALSKKQKGVETAYNKLGWADVHDALKEIYEAFSKGKHDKDFEYESTFWSVVGSRVAKNNPESKFRPNPKLRRRCYYGALEKFGNEFVGNSAGFASRAGFLMDEMIRAKERGELAWNRTLVPKQKMSTGEKSASSKAGNAGAHVDATRTHAVSNTKGTTKPLSAKKVYDSDDELDPPREEEMVEVPETQEEDAVAGAELEDEDADMVTIAEYPMSSINSRYDYAASLRSKTPKLGRKEFIKRCRAGAGRA